MLPAAPARVADLGCGTATLTQLLVDAAHIVDGVDFSPQMLRVARTKVPGSRFVLGDAADPPLPRLAYDVVKCRHLLWALSDPASAFTHWLGLLRHGGIAALIEGQWSAGAGLAAAQTQTLITTPSRHIEVRPLTEANYWGKTISDERYLLISRPER